MSDHVWAQENIAAYVAGGLEPAEAERLEKHAAECADCARAVDEARALEGRLAPLFRDANPGPALEDRLIRTLAEAPRPMRSFRLTTRVKVILGAAAAVMLAISGAGLTLLMDEGRLGFGISATYSSIGSVLDRSKSPPLNSSAPQAVVMSPDGRMPASRLPLGTDWGESDNLSKKQGGSRGPGGGSAQEQKGVFLKTADDLAKDVTTENLSLLSKIKNEPKAEAKQVVPMERPADAEVKRPVGQLMTPPAASAPAGASTPPPAQPELPGTFHGTGAGALSTHQLQRPNEGKDGKSPYAGTLNGNFYADPYLPGGGSSYEYTDRSKVTSGGGSGGAGPGSGGFGGGFGRGPGFGVPGGGAGGMPGMPGGPASGVVIPNGAGGPGGGGALAITEKDAKGKEAELLYRYSSSATALPALRLEYFKPGDSLRAGVGVAKGDIQDGFKKLEDTKEKTADVGGRSGAAGYLGKSSGNKQGGAKGEEAAQKNEKGNAAAVPEPTPLSRRIIIRTGEVEFEIDSFDASVATIMRLVTATKGGFVATINSDKLANGKVKGSVVVRMPPGELDKFLLDLRKELSKTGELKNQRIGSQDITKQYTDLESRLKAARAMEERLLRIIKDGKGQIKDLLAAEKELGVWRTKIEEMEGELRYYANQASLSTLTINIYEKEIRTAATVTESERVQAGIEADDVEKAHQDALKAILEAKGRVTRSELKQLSAGQFNAVLHFEVSPDAAGPMRDRLKQLGNMVRLQIDRIQSTDNNGPAPKDGKLKRGDTQFVISIYNLANIAPRETVILRIAAADVSAIYQKLRLAIAKAKGHVVNANLDEKDKLNINAQLDFDVRRLTESDVQAALTNAGDTLSRQVNRVPENDNVTDSKVLYRITLVDADSIQPRETLTLKLAVTDVPAAYRKLKETVGKLKARVFTAQIDEHDKRNIIAKLYFAFRRTDEGSVQMSLAAAGETLSKQVTRLPESANVTDAKVLANIELIDLDAIQPREIITVKIAAVDVPAAYRKLKETVGKVKPRVINSQLNEQDRRNITAQFEFTVGRSDEGILDGAFTGAGEILSRQVTRLPETGAGLVTDSKVLSKVELIDAASMPPRETVTLKIAAVDVPAAYQKLRDAVSKAKGRIATAQLNEQDRRNVTAQLVFQLSRTEESAVQTTIADAGDVLTREVTRQPENVNVTDTRVAFKVDLSSASAIAPRRTTVLALEVADVDKTVTLFNAEVREAQGRTVQTQVSDAKDGQRTARIVYDIPLTAAAGLVQKFSDAGRVRVDQVTESPEAPEGKLALGRIIVTVSNTPLLVPSDKGLWSEVRHGLALSLRGLSLSASFLIVGLLFVLPWLLLIYVAVWLIRRMFRGPTMAVAGPGGTTTEVPTTPAG